MSVRNAPPSPGDPRTWAWGSRRAQHCCTAAAAWDLAAARPPAPLSARRAVLVVLFGETLNSLGAQHWEAFATQPYFDANGVFFSAVISAPLMVIMFLVLVGGGGCSSCAWPCQHRPLAPLAPAHPPPLRTPPPIHAGFPTPPRPNHVFVGSPAAYPCRRST
jgi:hypothetical protein